MRNIGIDGQWEWKTQKIKWNAKYFCFSMIHIFLVVGDGSLAVELDLHKATAKQTGRATHCFLIRIFLTKKSGIIVWTIDVFISSLDAGAGGLRQLSARRSALQKGGRRGLDVAKACSAGCGMLRGGQKEVGTYKQILEEGAHRRAFLFSCDMLVVHLLSLGLDGVASCLFMSGEAMYA